jgi:flagellar biogenesis protein FliO
VQTTATSVATTSSSVVHHVQAAAHAASHAVTPSLAPAVGIDWVRELGAMLVIIGALWAAARYMKKKSGGGLAAAAKAGPDRIVVLSRQVLAKGISIAIVRVGGKDLLVGITPSGVSLLTELDLSDAIGEESGWLPGEEAYADPASLERGDISDEARLLAGRFGGASPLQAWMAKLDGLREMTVRRS